MHTSHTWLDAQLDQKFLDGLYIKVYHTYMKYYYMIGNYHKCIEKGGLAVKSLHKEMAEQLAEEWGCEGNQIVSNFFDALHLKIKNMRRE